MQQDDKSRVAIGVFSDVVELRRVVKAFKGCGADTNGIVLLADAGKLSAQLEAEFAAKPSDDERRSPKLFIRDRAKRAALHGAGALPLELEQSATHRLLDFESWISSKLSKDLNEHLAAGACILIFPVASAELEVQVSKILLQHSVGSVQLHDMGNGNNPA